MCLNDVVFPEPDPKLPKELRNCVAIPKRRKRGWKYTDEMAKMVGERIHIYGCINQDNMISAGGFWWLLDWVVIKKDKPFLPPPKSVIAYKSIVVLDKGDCKGGYVTCGRNFLLKIGKTYVDKQPYNHGCSYPLGFHCWKSQEAAKKWERGCMVLKVKISNIVAMGYQDRHFVYVARKMKVLGVVRRKKHVKTNHNKK